MVWDKQGVFQPYLGFLESLKFRLVELRSYVFPCYVFLGVKNMEWWWLDLSEVGHADPYTQTQLPIILKTPKNQEKKLSNDNNNNK